MPTHRSREGNGDSVPIKPSLREVQAGDGKDFYLLGMDGRLADLGGFRRVQNADFRKLVEREALGISGTAQNTPPEHIRHMQKFGMGWEPMSDSGHMRYGPEGALIFGLVSDYANRLAREVGVPVYNVLGTNMFNLDEPAVRQHADLFGDRLYHVDVGDKQFVLRYAACHQQFAMIRDWTISHRNLPFGAFEIADSYRLEQSGELLLGFRLRRMNMPDLHIFTADMESAKKVLIDVHRKIYEAMHALGRDYVSLYNTTSMGFMEKERDFLRQLLAIEQKPALVAVYPSGKDYYWVLNIEYHVIDGTGKPREIGTVQIDVGNAQRFGINYRDSNNEDQHPVILHTALIGTVERYIFTLFDTALQKGERNAALPTWASPTQVRLCPITESNLARANEIADLLEASGIRVDIDDRDQKLPHKIRDAEKHWVPYTIVLGDKEEHSDEISVRGRGFMKKCTLAEFVGDVKEEIRGMPFRPLPYPRGLANRPLF